MKQGERKKRREVARKNLFLLPERERTPRATRAVRHSDDFEEECGAFVLSGPEGAEQKRETGRRRRREEMLSSEAESERKRSEEEEKASRRRRRKARARRMEIGRRRLRNSAESFPLLQRVRRQRMKKKEGKKRRSCFEP